MKIKILFIALVLQVLLSFTLTAQLRATVAPVVSREQKDLAKAERKVSKYSRRITRRSQRVYRKISRWERKLEKLACTLRSARS